MTDKLRQLTVFLLRPGVTEPEQIFKHLETLERTPLRPELTFGGSVYTRRSRQRRPPWLEFVPVPQGLLGNALMGACVDEVVLVPFVGRDQMFQNQHRKPI